MDMATQLAATNPTVPYRATKKKADSAKTQPEPPNLPFGVPKPVAAFSFPDLATAYHGKSQQILSKPRSFELQILPGTLIAKYSYWSKCEGL